MTAQSIFTMRANMKILFKYPTRSRPDWFKKTLGLYYTLMNSETRFEFVVSLNKDDETMNNKPMRKTLDSIKYLSYLYGDHKNKIAACNADVDLKKEWDILVLVSDDMIPSVNFDKIIIENMQKHFPNLDGALHFNDGYCGGKNTITFSILGRKLYEKIGYIYHPSYNSFYCDNEFTDVVRSMKAVHYDPRVIVKHKWTGGGSSKDALYRMNTKLGKDDGKTYNKRKHLGFPK